jgi:hypothetical protein
MPFVVSSGGAFRGNRWLKFNGRVHNDLHVSLLNAFDVDTNTFGMAKHCTGALPGLV